MKTPTPKQHSAQPPKLVRCSLTPGLLIPKGLAAKLNMLEHLINAFNACETVEALAVCKHQLKHELLIRQCQCTEENAHRWLQQAQIKSKFRYTLQ